MDKKVILSLIELKIEELKNAIKKMRMEEGVRAKGTITTQTHLKRREIKTLTLVSELIKNATTIKLTEESHDCLVSLTTLTSERQMGSIHVNEGDSLMKILQEHQDTKNTMEKIQKACEKAGLTIDYSTGTIVKKN